MGGTVLHEGCRDSGELPKLDRWEGRAVPPGRDGGVWRVYHCERGVSIGTSGWVGGHHSKWLGWGEARKRGWIVLWGRTAPTVRGALLCDPFLVRP